MNPGLVEHHYRWFSQLPRQRLQLINNKCRRDRPFSGGIVQLILTRDQAKTVQPLAFSDLNTDRFTLKLPAVGDVAFLADTGFIAIKQVNSTRLTLRFYKAKCFTTNLIKLSIGFAFGP